ncbi:hypothetical protein FFI97_005785 [Variovorax sp. KBS0712]|uniref:hypothetical protein n=1 Tax=Variovorax sp. KBS0712 TaxID=2578111 RepID=UPI00116AC9DE|nr:hypothetical protein [Variovorax sp. KBS0712]TSD59056.1 hypothetical protein FFI97_001620 [Variovorax sp. KBS0712]TSD59819.1 hypothetical protein FFI97_005785 [Variovorax sp. KBS0712]
MSRPPKPGGPFDAHLTLRLPTEDRAAWRAAAATANLGVSDWLRSQVAAAASVPGAFTGRGAPRRPAAVSDPKLTWLASNISSSCNQLAKHVNTAAVIASPIQAVQILESLKAIEETARELFNSSERRNG